MRRTRDWNEGLAQDLRDQEFAREFLLAAMGRGRADPDRAREGRPGDGRQGVRAAGPGNGCT